MNEKTRVHSAPEREAPSPAITPNPLGLPEAELPMIVLDKVRSEHTGGGKTQNGFRTSSVLSPHMRIA